MARPNLTPEQRGEARERIRRHALELYAEGGLEAVSIRAVAQRAGLSPTGIYSFFRGRQELIEALWLDPVRRFLETAVRLAAVTPDPIARIGAVLDLYVDFVIENPEIHRGALLHVRSTKEVAPMRRSLAALDLHRVLREAVADGQEVGRIRAGDADLLAQSLWAGIHGALALPVHMEAWALDEARGLAGQTRTLLLDGLCM